MAKAKHMSLSKFYPNRLIVLERLYLGRRDKILLELLPI
jgi:hypothetical protein